MDFHTSLLRGKIWTSSLTKESLEKRFKSAEPDLIRPSRQTLSALGLTFATTSGPGDVKVRVKRCGGGKKKNKSLEISSQRCCWESFEATNQHDLKVNSRTHNAPASPGNSTVSGVDLQVLWRRHRAAAAATATVTQRCSALLSAPDGRLLKPRVRVEGARQSINHRVDPRKAAKQFAKK